MPLSLAQAFSDTCREALEGERGKDRLESLRRGTEVLAGSPRETAGGRWELSFSDGSSALVRTERNPDRVTIEVLGQRKSAPHGPESVEPIGPSGPETIAYLESLAPGNSRAHGPGKPGGRISETEPICSCPHRPGNRRQGAQA